MRKEILPCPNKKCTGTLIKVYDCKFIDADDGYKTCMYCCTNCLKEFLGTEKLEKN